MDLSLNPSIVVQGVLTFVTAIACSDAIKELHAADGAPSPNLANKVITAMIVVMIVLLLLLIFPARVGHAVNTSDAAGIDKFAPVYAFTSP